MVRSNGFFSFEEGNYSRLSEVRCASETPPFFPYADRFPFNRGDLLETSQISTIDSIVRLASLGLGTFFGLQWQQRGVYGLAVAILSN